MKADKPSNTAIFVANGVWWVTNHPQLSVEVPELMGNFNLEMVKHINRGAFSLQTRAGRWLLKSKTSLMQKIALPGFYLHFVVRKRCIEKFVRAAINKGAEQLIVVGAGFDALSLRIAIEYPDLTVIEIDHPATQVWKRNVLDGLDQRFNNHYLLPLDLTQDTMQAVLLRNEYYDRNKPSAFVAEGLLMYLAEKEVREIINFVKANSGIGSRFIFTYMEEQTNGSYQFKNASLITNWWLKVKGEQFTWGLRNEQLAPFLIESGLRLLECKTHKELRAEFISTVNRGAQLAIGENIAVAQLDR